MPPHSYFDRDISWLSFNHRVLLEAEKEQVPLMERIRFLSIFSSNLDEFYRVRMPALMALHKLSTKKNERITPAGMDTLPVVNDLILRQQEQFGKILTRQILPLLQQHEIHLLYHEPFPAAIKLYTTQYFFSTVLAFLQPIYLSASKINFFPENNKLYLLVIVTDREQVEHYVVINIPSDSLPRFYSVTQEGRQYIVFLEDIIEHNIDKVFPQATVNGCYNFKITRDGELDLKDEYEGDLAKKIEYKIARRDFGLATRFLCERGLPQRVVKILQDKLGLSNANIVEGGVYHNLKDLSSLPVTHSTLFYKPWPAVHHTLDGETHSLLDQILKKDIILHAPYQTYDTVLRFFNEASIDSTVNEIYVTLYRVASDSKIVNALISAARNGKKVTVFVELKARFDEANNIKWARRMKEAGVRIIYSIPTVKVHAKIALVKRKHKKQVKYFGLFSTGNFNERTAKYYTDHTLLTSHQEMLQEVKDLFVFLTDRKKPKSSDQVRFDHLLVAQFNLLRRFIALIDREIRHAREGLPASIMIKLNNLEERVLINKLYEASNAGVTITLIVRSICCLIPGVRGMSENITVRRIVDRYLEHGRIFIFHNNGDTAVFMGSADWMNRNIYRRIEVCFPVYDPAIKKEIIDIFNLQLKDNVQAVMLDSDMNQVGIRQKGKKGQIQSQKKIYELVLGITG